MVNLFFVPDTHLEKPLKLQHFKGSRDGYLFEWNEECGMTLFVIINNISDRELDSISNVGTSFEIAFSEKYECGFLSVKFGGMPWGEGTFEPLLYQFLNMPYYDEYENESNGMALTVCTIDPSRDCLVMGIRLIGLGHEFSVGLSKWAHRRYFDKKARAAFTRERHYEKIGNVFKQFTSEELQSTAMLRWKIAGESSPKVRNAINIEEK